MHYLFADCVLDTQCYLLRRAGQSIRLRPKVFQVLTYLLIHRDRVIPKHELCEQVWSAPAVSDATLTTVSRPYATPSATPGRRNASLRRGMVTGIALSPP